MGWVRRATLGDRHPSTLGSMWSYAVLLIDQGKKAEARPLLEQAVRGFTEVLGPRHPDTVGATSWLKRLE